MSMTSPASSSSHRSPPSTGLVLALATALCGAAVGCKSKSNGGSGGTDGGAGSGGSGGSGGSSGGGSGGKGSGGTGGTSGKGGGGSGGGSGSGSMTCTGGGGPVSGDKDMHCIDSSGAEIKQTTSEAACNILDAGATTADDGGAEEMHATLYNSEGDDDDCKYHLKWTVSCVEQNKDVTFNVTVTKKADGMPLTGAASNSSLEVFLSDTHVAPNTKQVGKETSPGQYTLGPIRFDAPGNWTVRFHLRETCADIDPESPHGHAAFYVNVP